MDILGLKNKINQLNGKVKDVTNRWMGDANSLCATTERTYTGVKSAIKNKIKQQIIDNLS